MTMSSTTTTTTTTSQHQQQNSSPQPPKYILRRRRAVLQFTHSLSDLPPPQRRTAIKKFRHNAFVHFANADEEIACQWLMYLEQDPHRVDFIDWEKEGEDDDEGFRERLRGWGRKGVDVILEGLARLGVVIVFGWEGSGGGLMGVYQKRREEGKGGKGGRLSV